MKGNFLFIFCWNVYRTLLIIYCLERGISQKRIVAIVYVNGDAFQNTEKKGLVPTLETLWMGKDIKLNPVEVFKTHV